ncbi:DUF1801 domain-containing protein [Pseudarthrobacter sp. J75]|uniref:DUF1801 domain-containing protein n=1 Tax=unclassified Pseudarthrobacter TaxID=2647000 RepID=UPI002E8036B4|nr:MULTISPECIES: DUF1801 domain-containing protein [unclassified Pseudarthrobacter]MEE2524418.1 DUF1801 domain-containing protein [Pseudarthrobacter sp. J47]MEE2529849.1 DUF1801 domain-containing protein [Pseudarthrobacter sp. J75]
MSQNKTRVTGASATEFVEAVEHPVRRADGLRLLEMMGTVTGEEPRMWGESIVGFGSYHYRYATGHEGDAAAVGFSPRKASLSLYGLSSAPEAEELLARLGKHKLGAGCLYINKLADVDVEVLTELVRAGYRYYTTEVHHS